MIRFFRVFVPAGALALFGSEILLILSSYILATYVFLTVDPTVFLLYDRGLVRILLVLASILVGMHFHDLYSNIYVRSRRVLIQQLCLVIGAAFLVQALIGYLDATLRIPIRVMVLGSFFAVVSIFAWRVFFSAHVLRVVARDRLLLVGASPLLEDIGKHIEEHPETGLQVVGYVRDREEAGTAMAGGEVLGPMASLREIVQATNPDRIVVGMTERRARMPVSELLELRFAGHIIEEAASTYEKVCGRMCLKELRPSQLIYTGELGPRRVSLFYQMATNLILAAIGVVVAAPIMLLTALAVRLTSAGPVLYRQVRVGMDGRPFTLYKFRSMRANAEAETGAVWASKDDPRVTPLGRTLRKLRIDEIPQLFNVLKTEMSIVGPRPERPEMVQSLAQQIPYYRHRHCVRPGITGWAQVNYKYGDTLDDVMRKLEYDLYYIKNMSPSLDAYIIFLTIKATLLSRGSQ
jgi:sugar transferase (PEP-CTERM system associated)